MKLDVYLGRSPHTVAAEGWALGPVSYDETIKMTLRLYLLTLKGTLYCIIRRVQHKVHVAVI